MSGNAENRAIPAASGYPQYSGNLMHPLVSQDLLDRFYCTTVFGAISTTEYTGELIGKGDKITFFRKPEVSVRRHVKDGRIKHDTLESKPHTMVVDKACEWSVKIACVDERMMGLWPKLKEGMIESASNAIAMEQDKSLLQTIYLDADPDNMGNKAGVNSHCYRLGELGDPVVIEDGFDAIKLLSRVHGVLNEQCVPKVGRYGIMPEIFETFALQSEHLARVGRACDGLNADLIFNGMMPEKIMNFTLFTNSNLTEITDPVTGAMCYYCIFGLPMATAWASVLEKVRTIDNDKDSWDIYYQGLLVYGFDVIYPNALAVAYVTFDKTNI